MRHVLTLNLLIAILLPLAAQAESTSDRPAFKIEGLQHVKLLPRAHWYQLRKKRIYQYKVFGREELVETIKKIKKIHDLRPLEEIHPIWNLAKQKTEFFGPPVEFLVWIASLAVQSANKN